MLKTPLPRIGYMAHMKVHWDELLPELNHFNSKQLRQQAIHVEKQDGVLNTLLDNETPNTDESRSQASQDNETNVEIPINLMQDDDTFNREIIDQDSLRKITHMFTYYFHMFEKKSLQYNISVHDDIKKAYTRENIQHPCAR